jgi:hypothetical protein
MKWASGLFGTFIGYAIGVQIWNVLVNFELMATTVDVRLLAVPYAVLLSWASYRGGPAARWCWCMAVVGELVGAMVVPILAPRAPLQGIVNDGLYVTGPIGAAVAMPVGAVIGVIRARSTTNRSLGKPSQSARDDAEAPRPDRA